MRSQRLKREILTEPPLEVSTLVQRRKVGTRLESRSKLCNTFGLIDWRAQSGEGTEGQDGNGLEDRSHVSKIG